MNGLRCENCGSLNLATDPYCRKCGESLMLQHRASAKRIGPREARKQSSRLPTLFILLLLTAAAYYIFSGVERSYEKIESSEQKRLSAQPAPRPQLSRSQFEQQRTQTVGNAIKNGPGLAQSQQHVDDTNKLMQVSTGKPAKR